MLSPGRVVAAVLPLLALLAGCAPDVEKRACMGGGAPSSLVSGAALFRLDVYSGDIACAGASVASGAGLPLVSHVYARGERIALDVTPGSHAVVLTTYADAQASEPLGQGCVVADLAAGSEICFDLTLDPYRSSTDDLGVPPSDGGGPSDGGDDLSSSGPDLAPACTHLTADFSAASSLPSPWMLTNSAVFDSASGGGVILNSAVNTIGGLFFGTPVATTAFDATFTYRIAGPDGIALVLANQGAGFVQNTTSGAGEGIGYVGMTGYAFELDTWQNANDPNNNHVGFTHAFDGTHIVTGTPSVTLDCGGCTRTAHVRLTPTHLKFDINGVAAFDGDLAPTGSNAFAPGTYFFGFTASTGNVTGPPTFLHAITKVDIIIGPAGTCF